VTPSQNALDGKAVALMLFLTLSWGLNSVLAKISTTGYDPVFLTVARSAIAAAAVYAWCLYRRINLFEHDGTLIPGIAAGIFFGLEFLAMFIGFEYSSVGRISLLVNTMPFFVLVCAHYFLGERMTPAKVAGLVLAFIGVAIIFSDKMPVAGDQVWIGDLLGLAAAVLWAATTLVIKGTRLTTASAEKVLMYQLVVSAIVIAPMLLTIDNPIRDPDWTSTAALLTQAVFIVAFTYVLWFWLMRQYPASALSSFTFLTPAFSVFGGWLILSEPVSWRLALSLAMIGAGIYIVNRPRRTVPPSA